MSTAIYAENLGKQYWIGTQQNRGSLGELINRRLFDPLGRKAAEHQHHGNQEFWALRAVTFDIQHGDSVGLIGQNGSGKSTLLKLLARVMRPTEGKLRVQGRLGSLIEVGVGFHPELTGRDNIFLNGSILGMSRAEIARKFDEIVDFSGIEQFIDTPVKFYSTGMYLRLAFSVSIHLDPDILLIDEVFAVGDQDFQRKCMRYLAKARQDGQTIVLVSHSMNIIAQQCHTALWLNRGQLVAQGAVDEVVSSYLLSQGDGEVHEHIQAQETESVIDLEVATADSDSTAEDTASAPTLLPPSPPAPPTGIAVFDPPLGGDGFWLDRLYIIDGKGEQVATVDYAEPFSVVYEYHVDEALENLKLGLVLNGTDQPRILLSASADSIRPDTNSLGERGIHRVLAPLPARWFMPGVYSIEIGVASAKSAVHCYEPSALKFRIDGPEFDFTSVEILHPTLAWKHERLSNK